MKHTILGAILSLSVILVSQNVWAGCGQVTTQCLVINDGIESTEPCEITSCANTSEYIVEWALDNGGSVSDRADNDSHVIKVDSQDGISMPASILKDNLTCYATRDVSIIYCAKDVWL